MCFFILKFIIYMCYTCLCDLVHDVYADFTTSCLLTDYGKDKRINYSIPCFNNHLVDRLRYVCNRVMVVYLVPTCCY